MNINLVKDGIFPILYNKNGNKLEKELDTNFNFSGTIQGEGKLTGVPCLFIRLSGCNLRCLFSQNGIGSPCDTPYSSHTPERNRMEVEEIIDIVSANTNNGVLKHIVISGGEPFIQKKPLRELIHLLNAKGLHTTIETNGSIFDKEVAMYTNLFSISPKLKNSVPTQDKFKGQEVKKLGLEYNALNEGRHESARINISALQSFIDECYVDDQYKVRKNPNDKDFQLKFVVSSAEDIAEIQSIVSQLKGVENRDILLMPEGYTKNEMLENAKMVSELCIKYGYTLTVRIHTALFGELRGI